jgi:DNA-binding response OmpR family regulator
MAPSIERTSHLSLPSGLVASARRLWTLVKGAMGEGLSGHSILVVEDDPRHAWEITDALNRLGAQVVVAHSLQKALEVIESRTWSAAVLDHWLGEGDCNPLAEQLVARGVPFIVCTSDAQVSGSCTWGEMIPKPLNVDVLAQAIEELISRNTETRVATE